MEITQQVNGPVVEMRASGRIDGYWSEHLEQALAAVVSAGHHKVRLDCADVTFMSSAGIAVLMKFRKELSRVDGTFHVVNPSKPVASTLKLARLLELLVDAGSPAAASAAPIAPAPAAAVRRRTIEEASFEIYELDASATLTCRPIGDAALLPTGGFTEAFPLSADGASPAFALGVGAFGDSFDDCRPRFGELLSVAGATAYQPADGTNVPDYLVARGGAPADVRVLYGLSASGRFSHVLRFESHVQGAAIGLSRLLRACLEIAGVATAGVAILAET